MNRTRILSPPPAYLTYRLACCGPPRRFTPDVPAAAVNAAVSPGVNSDVNAWFTLCICHGNHLFKVTVFINRRDMNRIP